jgi:hypothetical protein
MPMRVPGFSQPFAFSSPTMNGSTSPGSREAKNRFSGETELRERMTSSDGLSKCTSPSAFAGRAVP